jgi:hypothetical protein
MMLLVSKTIMNGGIAKWPEFSGPIATDPVEYKHTHLPQEEGLT